MILYLLSFPTQAYWRKLRLLSLSYFDSISLKFSLVISIINIVYLKYLLIKQFVLQGFGHFAKLIKDNLVQSILVKTVYCLSTTAVV